MALANVKARTPKGSAKPRLAPPVPVRTDIDGFRETAADVGIALMPWQETAARYLEAQAADGRHLYREVGVVVARQNGKTTLLVPLIIRRLKQGRKIVHAAQNREIPREVFGIVADILAADETLFPERNGRRTRPRFANGQEEIRLANGGAYSIVAPTRSGARGKSGVDDLIIDELREMEDWGFIAAAKPTMTASPDRQVIYLSNAGAEHSVVLNALRDRAGKDEALAYLEWSADPDLDIGDERGWAQANPAMGHEPEGMGSVYETLVAEHRAAVLQGTTADFETEHLCRWVKTMREPLVLVDSWAKGETADVGSPVRPLMGVSMDPAGKRASAAIAWQQGDGTIALQLVFDVTGDPIDTDRLGRDMKERARQLGVTRVAFDPLTDAVLASHFRRTEAVIGSKYANASARFVTAIESGKLRWVDCESVGLDLEWTARKPHDESGSFQAVRADDERPITAALAAIRAVWLASAPRPESSTPSRPRRSTVGF